MSLRAWRDEQVTLLALCLSRSCVGSSVLCRGDHGLLVHRDARALACFHARAAAISILCRFSRFDPRGILVPSALPQSSFTRFAAHAFRRSRFLPGSRPSSRHHPLASTSRSAKVTRTLVFATAPAPALGTPALRLAPRLPLRSVLRRSQPLDGLLRARAHGLVSSRSHVQDHHRSGAFSPDAAALSRRQRLAPLPLIRARSPVSRLPPARTSASRPCSTSSRVASARR